MNREIKFRAWDEKQRKMYSWEHMTTGYLIGFLTGYYKDTHVMQFTGLKDKNNKEIYEGDIVQCWGGEYCQGYWEHSAREQVTFDPFLLMALSEYENVEVIGSIYENPELLQVTT
jgi:hypothetical protein